MAADADRRAEAEAEVRDALDRLEAAGDDADGYAAAVVLAGYRVDLAAALASEDAEDLDELRGFVLAALHRVENPPTAAERAEEEAEAIRAAVTGERLVEPRRLAAAHVLDLGRRAALMARLARDGAAALAERYGIADWRADPAAARDALLAEADRLLGTLAELPPAEAERLAAPLALASEVVAACRDVDAEAAAWTLAPLTEALRAVAGEATEAAGTLRAYAAVSAEPPAASLTLAAGTPAVRVKPGPPADLPAMVELPRYVTRSPIFAPASRAVVQLALGLWDAGTLYRHPFRVLEPRGPLTVRDALLLAHLVRRYHEDGQPAHRRVAFSLAEATGWLGYSAAGYRQRRLIRVALMRMRSTTYESVTRLRGGGYGTLAWGLIDLGATAPTVGGLRGAVTLSEPLAAMVATGELAYLESDTFRRLVERDEYAARLWVFLEGEAGPRTRAGWRWRVFSAPEGEPPAERDTPAVADLLRVADWDRRRDVARRVRQAAAVLEAEDPRYSLTVTRAAGRRTRGMWTLYASWTAALPGRAPAALLAAGGGDSQSRLLAEGDAETRGGVLRDAQKGDSETRQRVTARRATVRESAPNGISNGLSNDSLTRATRETSPEARRTVEAAIADALAEGRPDLAALYERTGWTRATPLVRRTLADIADRHDAGYAWVADRLREAPEGSRRSAVLAYVLDREAEDRARHRAEAEAADRASRERASRASARPPTAPSRVGEDLAATLRATFGTPSAEDAEPGPDRERWVADWRRAIVNREVPEAAARRAIADYAPDLDDLAELL
jgi:hypothetical protein